MAGEFRYGIAALTLAALAAGGPVLAAGEKDAALEAVYQRIIANPSDTAANLEYAALAEAHGQSRKALATYERILLYEPENTEARDGLTRLRRLVQPNTTLFTLEAGTAYETNPTLAAEDEDDDVRGFVNVRMQDERRLGDTRWRTIVSAGGDLYAETDVLNYGFLSATTGPVVDLGSSRIAVNPFVGTTVTGLDEDLYYTEAVAGAQFEGYLEGAYQSFRIRAGYRAYDETWASEDGFWADASAKISLADLVGTGDVLIFSPTVRWNDFGGTTVGTCGYCIEVTPGNYWQVGAKLEYYRDLADWLTVGAGVGIRQTWYNDQIAIEEVGLDRDDFLVSPTASVILHDLLAAQTDFKVDYRYDHNDSNQDSRDYENHTVSAKVVTRF